MISGALGLAGMPCDDSDVEQLFDRAVNAERFSADSVGKVDDAGAKTKLAVGIAQFLVKYETIELLVARLR